MSDYRIFVGAFPTGELADRIQAIRQQCDSKTARITPPHVTLWGTMWRSGPATPENEADTIAQLSKSRPLLAPFDLQLGGIQSFPPGNRVVYLAVEPSAGLMAIRKLLLQTLGPDKHRHFTPHLTLAMRLTETASTALFEQLRQSEWHSNRWAVQIDHLQLMQRGATDPAWRVINRLPINE